MPILSLDDSETVQFSLRLGLTGFDDGWIVGAGEESFENTSWRFVLPLGYNKFRNLRIGPAIHIDTVA